LCYLEETPHDLTHKHHENEIEEVSIADFSLSHYHDEDDAVCGTFFFSFYLKVVIKL
jgi:hypothetical protein